MCIKVDRCWGEAWDADGRPARPGGARSDADGAPPARPPPGGRWPQGCRVRVALVRANARAGGAWRCVKNALRNASKKKTAAAAAVLDALAPPPAASAASGDASRRTPRRRRESGRRRRRGRARKEGDGSEGRSRGNRRLHITAILNSLRARGLSRVNFTATAARFSTYSV